MNASSAETDENRNTKFRLNTGYTNCRINSKAEKNSISIHQSYSG